MRLVRGASGCLVVCSHPRHEEIKDARGFNRSVMFPLDRGYADLDGDPFAAYYCDPCADRFDLKQFVVTAP